VLRLVARVVGAIFVIALLVYLHVREVIYNSVKFRCITNSSGEMSPKGSPKKRSLRISSCINQSTVISHLIYLATLDTTQSLTEALRIMNVF
jgi:hypothetical protein